LGYSQATSGQLHFFPEHPILKLSGTRRLIIGVPVCLTETKVCDSTTGK